jgi:hypothetical protein
MLWTILAGCVCAAALALEKPRKDPPVEIVDPDVQPADPNSRGQVLEPDHDPDGSALDLPRAEISGEGEIALGCWLALDGSASNDPLGGPLEYQWQQVAGPKLALAHGDQKQAKLWLFLASPGEFRFVLRVKNKKGLSAPAERKFTVPNTRPPLPESEARKVLGAGELFALPGEGWQQVCGGKLELRNENGITTCRPARPGLYLFEAPRAGDVPERRGAVVPPGRDGVLGDRRPIAKVTNNLKGEAGKPLLINGMLSFDPDGAEETQQLQARWTLGDKYRGVKLEPLANVRAHFTAPKPGLYSVSLVVSDGRLDSEPPEHVFIEITPPVAAEEIAEEWLPDVDRSDPRFRKTTLGLWDNLDRAVRLFPSRCGITLRVDSEVAAPERFEQIPLALEVRDGAVLHLVDWIGRQTDSRYRREPGGRSMWLTTALQWAKEERLEPVPVQVDALYAKPDGSDLMACILPGFKQIIDCRTETSLTFDASRQMILGSLPASASARLKEICEALRIPEGQGLPPLELPTVAEFRLQKTLAEKVVTLKRERRRVDFLLRDLAEVSGVATGCDPRQFTKGLPYVNVDIVDAPLRDAVRTIVHVAGFDGCSVEPPGGLWFYRGARPYPSSELLWDHAMVMTYDLSRLMQQLGPAAGMLLSGEAIAYAIQRRVYPDSWKEPGALIFYHPPTRKLLVMHGPMAQRRVLEFLYDLGQRGVWALGPVEQ